MTELSKEAPMRTTIAAALLGMVVLGAAVDLTITAVTPSSAVPSTRPQIFTVTGEGFKPGLALQLTTPGGAVQTISGPGISEVRATSFQVSLTLDAPGRYSFVVINSDGQKTSAFPVEVKSRARAPAIDRVTPQELSKSHDPQIVTLTGRDFLPGLKVSLTDPTGTVTAVTALEKLEAQTVVVGLVFEQTGIYSVMVTNSSGESSNSVSVTVNGSAR
jgi:hypothetical protein